MESPLHIPGETAQDFEQLARQCRAMATQLKQQKQRMEEMHGELDVVRKDMVWLKVAVALLLEHHGIRPGEVRTALRKKPATLEFVDRASR